MIPETVVAMLACARIGAPHTVVFGGFSSDALRRPDRRLRRQGRHHRRRRLPPRRRRRRSSPPSTRRSRKCRRRLDVEHVLVVTAHRPGRRLGRRAATCGGTTPSTGASTEHAPEVVRLRAPALRHVHLRHDRQAQGHPAHHRRLPGRHVVHALGGLRPQGRRPTSTGAPPTSAG